MAKWQVFKINKRKQFDLIQSISKLSFYLKYCLSPKIGNFGMTYSFIGLADIFNNRQFTNLFPYSIIN